MITPAEELQGFTSPAHIEADAEDAAWAKWEEYVERVGLDNALSFHDWRYWEDKWR
jgi:hypothetical protein